MDVLVIGMGEVGRPLAELLEEAYEVERLDVEPSEIEGRPRVVHICYPYEIEDFVGTTARYLEAYRPELAIIDSTVGVGTTRKVWEATGIPVVHSPVRGKHSKMLADLKLYAKYIGAVESGHARMAAAHFERVGLETRILAAPEATELAKLSETTYFGLLIAWAQEVERYCIDLGVSYDEVVSFYEEIKFFPPVRYFPGVIGGHCVLPNVAILEETFRSPILEAIQWSNARKVALEDAERAEGRRAAQRKGA